MESSFITPSSNAGDTKTTDSSEVPFVGTNEANANSTSSVIGSADVVAPETAPSSVRDVDDQDDKTDKEDDGRSVSNARKWHPFIPLSFELPDSFVPAPPSRGGPGGEGPHLDSPVHISPMKLCRAYYDITGQVYYELYPNVYQLFKTRSNKARSVMMKNIITSLVSPDCIVLPVPYTAQTGRKPHPCVLVTADGLRKLVDILKNVPADVREAVDKLVELSNKVNIESEIHRAESMETHLVSMGPTWRKAFRNGEPEPSNNEQILRPRKSTTDGANPAGSSVASTPSSAVKRGSIASRRSRRHRAGWRKHLDESDDSDDGMDIEKGARGDHDGIDDDDDGNEGAMDGISASDDELETPRPKRARASYGEMDATQYRVGIVRMIEIGEQMTNLRARMTAIRNEVEALKQSYPGFSGMIAAEKKRLDDERKKKQIEQWMLLGQDDLDENANQEEDNSGDEDYRPGMSDDDDTGRAHPRNSTHAHHTQQHHVVHHNSATTAAATNSASSAAATSAVYPDSAAITDVSSATIDPNVSSSTSTSFSQQAQQQAQQQQYLSALVQQQQQQYSAIPDPALMNVKVAAMQYQLPPVIPPSSTYVPDQASSSSTTATTTASSNSSAVQQQQQQQQPQQLTTAFTSLSDVAAEAMAEDAEPNPMLSRHI